MRVQLPPPGLSRNSTNNPNPSSASLSNKPTQSSSAILSSGSRQIMSESRPLATRLSSKPQPTPGSRLIRPAQKSEDQLTIDHQLHSSAAAPRQSEAFKRLGQASLVSSSIFKSAPSTPNQPSSSRSNFALGSLPSTPALHSPTASSTPAPRSQFTPQRPPGGQSQMAAALQGLGIAPPPPSSLDPSRTASVLSASNRYSNTPHLRISGTKRKSDENLPIPPRAPPNLPPSAPPLDTMDNHSGPSKSRPPRQSLAFNCLTRHALVTSSPFKAPTGHSTSTKSSDPTLTSQLNGDYTSQSTSQPPPNSSDEGEDSSNESEPIPGTPPFLTNMTASQARVLANAASNSTGVLKSQRLGGPRSFTPPHSPDPTELATQTITSDSQGPAPQSALSTPGKRLERRKTVTWGGEDVVEFEREEEWRRASGASSSDSYNSPNTHPSEGLSPDSSCEVDVSVVEPGSVPHHFENNPHPQEAQFWGGTRDSSESEAVTRMDNLPTHAGQKHPEHEGDESGGSVIIHDLDDISDLQQETCGRNSFSSESDPVDQMVNALLTSPDLAGHIASTRSLQSWAVADVQHQPMEAVDDDVNNSLSDEEKIRKEEAEEAVQRQLHQQVQQLNTASTRLRFPYVRPETEKPNALSSVSAPLESSILATSDEIGPGLTTEAPIFRPISIPNLGAEESIFEEGSLICSFLESSTINVDFSSNATNSAPIPAFSPPGVSPHLTQSPGILSSTPRASYSHSLPSPEPVLPIQPSDLTAAIVSSVEESEIKSASPGSPRRPLPRPPPMTSQSSSILTSAQTCLAEPASVLNALTAPAYALPDIAQTSPFAPSSAQFPSPTSGAWSRSRLERTPSESETSFSSPGSSRKRITRQKIQERMREKNARSEDEQDEAVLLRNHLSCAASLHRLDADGEEEHVTLAPIVPDQKEKTIEPSCEIQARPPLRAQAVILSDSYIRPDDEMSLPINPDDVTLRQEDLNVMSSALDKLAHGFRSSEDGLKSIDSINSVLAEHDENAPKTLPSKLIPIKGAGRRRRSHSTGAADLEETGTGLGAQAAVRSSPVKRHTVTIDQERSQAVSALLNKAVHRGIGDTDFQAPLDRALKKICDDNNRSYRVQQSDELVIASDDRTTTIGVAGDVVDNRNWRKVRKVSDINQHAKELKTFWAQKENSSKIGKVFVKMSRLIFHGLPNSPKPVFFDVIIDNGLHTAKTATYKLEQEVSLGVEFELVRARKLEFSLAFNVPLDDPRNAHLKLPARLAQPEPTPQPILPVAPPSSPRRGLAAKLFGGGAKRHSKIQHLQQQQQQQQQQQMELQRSALAMTPPPHPILAHLDRNQTLAKAIVNFEEYADDSLGRMKQVVIPCMSTSETDPVKAEMQMRRNPSGPIGQITIEFLSLPPIPKIPDAVLPNSSAECLKGLKIAEWWQEVWHEGVLSQMGADCQTWKRRTYKATGGSLFAYNDIIKKVSAEIRLTEVVSLEDCGAANTGGPDDSTHSFISDQGEILPPFTFKLVFKDGSEILFHADNQTDYKRWKNVLGQLLGKIQKLPAWAEMLRLQIAAKRANQVKVKREEETNEEFSKPLTNRQPGKPGAVRSKPMTTKGSSSSRSTKTSSRSSHRSTQPPPLPPSSSGPSTLRRSEGRLNL